MSLVDQALPYVQAIMPYQPGKPISELARETGIAEGAILKLASNENPLGMSPRAAAAMQAALADLARYPDGNGFALKDKLARRLAVAPGQLVLGNGSNDVLELIARVFLAPGRAAVFAQHAFAVYPLATMATGARGIEVPALDFGHDLPAMQAAITPDTRLVFIANPNNPTGTFVEAEAVRQFIAAVPDDVVVVLDEAYNEYLPPAQRVDSVRWIASHPNLVVTRTFSKIYGLAGLRVGYAVASPAVADLMNRVRQPFNVNSLALAAACAAVDDEEFVSASYEMNRRGMAQIVEGLRTLALRFIPSRGNFITFEVAAGRGGAATVNQRLLALGVIVRPIAGYGLPDWLRVTIGQPEENARFLTALGSALDG
ncbi:MAG TPA: histidinol-phosphate transaminase [Rhodocyclaceae bacterium]